MPQIIKTGQQLEVVFKCQKCQTEFICDTIECTSEKNEKNPNKPFYCYDCPNCKNKCSTVQARTKGMGDIVERNNQAIQANYEIRKKKKLEEIMKEERGGYL